MDRVDSKKTEWCSGKFVLRKLKNEFNIVELPENMPIYEHTNTDYLISYIQKVLLPASIEFNTLTQLNQVKLHHAFSFTTILTHAIDYMVFIDRELNNRSRSELIEKFDEIYSVKGAKYLNQKFKLLDAVNNAFKHVELDQKMKKNISSIDQYGLITFNSLQMHDSKIYFVQQGYKFDYCRIILKPISAIFDCDIKTNNDVMEFLNIEKQKTINIEKHACYDNEYYEPWNAIDRMIEYCDPKCLDCGEFQSQCDCENFLYDKKKVAPNVAIDETFDFEKTIAQISSTREWTMK